MVAADVREIALPGPAEDCGRSWRRAGVRETDTGICGRSRTAEHDHAQQGSGDTGQNSVIGHLLLLPLSDLGVAEAGAEAAEKSRRPPRVQRPLKRPPVCQVSPPAGSVGSCYIARRLSKSWSTFSLTSTSTTLPSLTITVSRPNRCFFRRARASSSSVASRSLTPGGKPVIEVGLSNSQPLGL